jgi:2-polyprenyl-3-methyl-5-hydroxy-6-metoxy-1,4-benzoquinol methylase
MHGGSVVAAAPENACRLCGGEQTAAVFVKAGWTFVRCAACGLVSLRPVPTPEEVAAHHEASYRGGRYADFAAAATVRTAIARWRLAALRPLAPPGPWLDVGASTGTFVEEAGRQGLGAEGLELSAAAVAQARARGLAVHHGAAERFTPERRYAAITAFDIVEHLPEPLAFIRRVGSWLLPGGLLALTVPDAGSFPARLLGRHWFYYAPPDHIHYFTRSTILRLLDAAGLGRPVVRRALKPLTLDYAAAQLAAFGSALAPVARTLVAAVPRPWRERPWPLPLGEMLVTARAPGR